MTLKLAIVALFAAGLLSACESRGPEVKPVPALSPIVGHSVPQGVPCDHLVQTDANTVSGCEGYIPLSPLDSEHAAEIARLNARFAAEVQSVVNFDFGRAELTPMAHKIVDAQAEWMRRYVQIRFSVYGHTDLVGSEGRNFDLAKRRAEAVVGELVAKGVARDQLDALVSYGETRPVVATVQPEAVNRRTVTEVTGYATNPRLRTKVPVDCSLIDQIYLPSYPVCVKEPSVPNVVVPPAPVEQSTSTEETGNSSANIGTSAYYYKDQNTEIKDTAGHAGSVSTAANVTATKEKRTVTLSVNGVPTTYETDPDGSNAHKVGQ